MSFTLMSGNIKVIIITSLFLNQFHTFSCFMTRQHFIIIKICFFLLLNVHWKIITQHVVNILITCFCGFSGFAEKQDNMSKKQKLCICFKYMLWLLLLAKIIKPTTLLIFNCVTIIYKFHHIFPINQLQQSYDIGKSICFSSFENSIRFLNVM